MTNDPDSSTQRSSGTSRLSGKEVAALGLGVVPVRFGLAARLLGALVMAAVLTVVISVAIWPGEMKLLAPLFCTDAQPDAFVVTDSYQVRPGETSYNFSMYCMGPRGDVTSVGAVKPYAVLFGIHFAIVLVVLMLPGLGTRRSRTKARAASQPPGSTAGPFVD